MHASHEACKQEVERVKVESLRATHESGPVRARKAAMTIQACRTLMPPQAEPNTKVAKARGNIHKDTKGLKARKELLNRRIQEAKARRAASKPSGRPLTERQRRSRETQLAARKQAPQPSRNASGTVRHPRKATVELESEVASSMARRSGGGRSTRASSSSAP